jgi:hypothetical protein
LLALVYFFFLFCLPSSATNNFPVVLLNKPTAATDSLEVQVVNLNKKKDGFIPVSRGIWSVTSTDGVWHIRWYDK